MEDLDFSDIRESPEASCFPNVFPDFCFFFGEKIEVFGSVVFGSIFEFLTGSKYLLVDFEKAFFYDVHDFSKKILKNRSSNVFDPSACRKRDFRVETITKDTIILDSRSRRTNFITFL